MGPCFTRGYIRGDPPHIVSITPNQSAYHNTETKPHISFFAVTIRRGRSRPNGRGLSPPPNPLSLGNRVLSALRSSPNHRHQSRSPCTTSDQHRSRTRGRPLATGIGCSVGCRLRSSIPNGCGRPSTVLTHRRKSFKTKLVAL